ncbi:hypothetical protein RhiirC2_787286, partial [Rhizophagus irregularis]
MDQISSFFLQNHIFFGSIVDTHLSPKQMKFLSKGVCDYTSFHSDLDSTKHGRSSGGVSLFIHNSLATHVQFYQSHSSRILSVDLFFKGNVKLRIFVIYIPPTNDLVLRYEVIDQLISLISQTSSQNFHHAICGDFNMNLEKYYPIFLHQPQVAAKRIHKLFHYLLSHNYENCTPLNLSGTLGTYYHLDTITRIDFVWSCPLLRQYMLTASIFDAHDLHISDHNPIITYFDVSLLSDAIKSARALTVGNTYVSKKPKDLDSLCQSYRFLSKVAKTICSLHKTLSHTLCIMKLSDAKIDDFANLLQTLENMTLLLRSLLLLKEKEFQASSIQAKIDAQNDNFTNDISTFIESALSQPRRRIVLDRVFIDHPTHPTLLISPDAIDQEVIEHFQNF